MSSQDDVSKEFESGVIGLAEEELAYVTGGGLIRGAAHGVSNAANTVGDGAKQAGQGVAGGFQQAGQGIADGAKTIGGGVANVGKNIGDGAANAGKKAWKVIY